MRIAGCLCCCHCCCHCCWFVVAIVFAIVVAIDWLMETCVVGWCKCKGLETTFYKNSAFSCLVWSALDSKVSHAGGGGQRGPLSGLLPQPDNARHWKYLSRPWKCDYWLVVGFPLFERIFLWTSPWRCESTLQQLTSVPRSVGFGASNQSVVSAIKQADQWFSMS